MHASFFSFFHFLFLFLWHPAVSTDIPGPAYFLPLIDLLIGPGSAGEIQTLTTMGITGDIGDSDPTFV